MPGDIRRSLPETWWPMAASTVAMALIPEPPMPSTCTARGDVRSIAGGGHGLPRASSGSVGPSAGV